MTAKITGILLTCLLIYGLFVILSDAKENITEDITNRNLYIVKYPITLSLIGFAGIVIDTLIYTVFLIAHLQGNMSVGIGEFIFCIVTGIVFFIYILFGHSWKIVVHYRVMYLSRLFSKTSEINLYDIDYAEINKNFTLILYKDNEKLIDVNLLCNNYELLLDDLKKEGVYIRNNNR